MAADHLSLGMAEVARRLAHAEAERDALRAALEALTAEADHFKFVVLKPQLYTDRCTQHRAHRYLAAVEAAGRVLHAHGVAIPAAREKTDREAAFSAPVSSYPSTTMCATCGKSWGAHFGLCCDEEPGDGDRRFAPAAAGVSPHGGSDGR